MAIRKVQIWKRDKWNMIHAEVRGREVEVVEISDQWGEDTHVFTSRAELRHWVAERFKAEKFQGTEEERLQIIQEFQLL
jgi:hypothetical protein